MIKKLCLASLILVASLFLRTPASALEAGDVVLRVSPVEQEIELLPGVHATGFITVQNAGREPFTFSVSATPYQVTNEDYDPDFVSENSYTKLHNWITFPETSFQLEPGAIQEVYFDINVPDDVPGGGQYAAIMVETRDTIDESAIVQTVGRIASLLYAHVSGDEHIGGVLMGNSFPSFLLSPNFSVSATVKNDGNVDFRVYHRLTIRDFFTGREVLTPDTVTADDQTPGIASPVVLPGTARTNVLTWNGAPQLGVFRVQQQISFLDQVYDYEKIVVFCPIWLILLVLIFLLTVIIWLIIRIAGRKKRRPQVF